MRLARLLIPLAELSIVGSYGRGGHRLRAPDFDPADLAVDLTGQVYVITGATSGIGLSAAKALATLGATTVLVGRSADKLARAVAEVPGSVAERCDLSDLADVEALCRRLTTRWPRLHGLVHNAGFIVPERRLTRDGHESAFATHVLAPFLMTHRLAPALAHGGRVVWVSSGGMYTQKLDLDRARALTGPYDGVRAYAQHKRAQVLLSELFARALGPGLTSNAMHPGWVDTPGVEQGIPKFHRRMRRHLRTPEQGADTIVWLLAAPRLAQTSGRFFLDRVARRTELFPWTRHREADREALWALCCTLTGVAAPVPAASRDATQPVRDRAGPGAAPSTYSQ